MWLKSIWDRILNYLGINNTITTDTELSENSNYTARYEDISEINFCAIISNRLATLAVSESDLSVPADNRRAELIGGAAAAVWAKIKKITAMALGTGGAIIVPYVQDGKILFDIATQDRLCINEKIGEKITKATVLADVIDIKNVKYYRFVDYSVENDRIIISNRVTTSSGMPAKVAQWETLQDIAIAGVDRVLFGFIKSPIDNRKSMDKYGVPVTYGCDSIIKEIKQCLEQVKDEFELKQVRLRVDERDLRDENGEIKLKSKLFFKSKNVADESLFDAFDPTIRESSFYTRLTNLFEQLEKAVGTSRGILTEPEASYENTQKIREALGSTWAIITAIRTSVENGLKDYLYACDVLANYYNLTPQGDYDVVYDWDYSLIESSSETWQQLKDGQSIGVRSKAELRAWQTGETIEEAQKAIDEIAAKEPSLNTLLGMDEVSTPSETGMKKSIEDDIDDTVTKQLNGAQTQSLINIVMQYKQGVLSEGQAINIISTSVGISKEQATVLLRA